MGTIDSSAEALTAEMARLGLPVREAWRDDTRPCVLIAEGAHHHLGTTRMHHDPRHGVVDAHGRVHGMANLYVTSGSVMPTGGYANPTLTVLALALRLGEHLRGLLAPPPLVPKRENRSD